MMTGMDNNFHYIISAYNPTLHWPERESNLIHYTVNYLKSLHIPGERITVMSEDLGVLSWAKAEELNVARVPDTPDEAILSIAAEHAGMDIMVLDTQCPVREADLLDVMASQIATEKDVIFISAYMGLKRENVGDYPAWTSIVDGSVWGFRHDSNLKAIKKMRSIYYVYHDAFAGHFGVSLDYQYDKEVLDIAVKRGWEKSASTAPCSADYPRRVQIMVDKPKQNI